MISQTGCAFQSYALCIKPHSYKDRAYNIITISLDLQVFMTLCLLHIAARILFISAWKMRLYLIRQIQAHFRNSLLPLY